MERCFSCRKRFACNVLINKRHECTSFEEDVMIKNTEQPSYYSRFPIQPIDFISANKIDFLVGNVIKYVCRYDAKNGVEDLKKAKVYLEKLIERTEQEVKEWTA